MKYEEVVIFVADERELDGQNVQKTISKKFRIPVRVIFTGVGKSNASKALLYELHYNGDPLRTLFINAGTCGSIKNTTGSLIIFNRFVDGFINPLNSEMDSVSYYPEENQFQIITVSEFIKNTSEREKLEKYDGIDMESFIYVRGLSMIDHTCHVIKVVSDNLDIDLMEWRERAKRYQTSLNFGVIELIKKIINT